MKKTHTVFFKQLKIKQIIAMVVAFTFLMPAFTSHFRAESVNLADLAINPNLVASASVNAGAAMGAFQYDGSWQNPGDAPIGNGKAHWVSLDFGKEVTFDGVKFNQYNKAVKKFSIQISDDGNQWTTVFQGIDTAAVAPEGGQGWNEYLTVRLSKPVTTRHYRLLLEETADPTLPRAIIGLHWIHNDSSFTTSPEIKDITNEVTELAHGLEADAYSASSNNGGDQTADKAFDEDPGSVWQAAGGAQINAPQWLMVDLGSAKTVSRVDFSQYNNRAKQFKFQMSDDATSWRDVFNGEVASAADAGGTVDYTVVFPEASGRYFRIFFAVTAGDTTGAQTQPAIFDMKVYDKAGDGATSPEIACGNLADTSANPNLVASASVNNGDAAGAFQYNGIWQNTNEEPIGGGKQQWLALDFGEPVTFNGVKYQQYGRRLKQFSIQISDDGARWTTVFKGSDNSIPAEKETWDEYTSVRLNKPVRAKHFRFLMEEVFANEPKVIIGQIFIYNDAAFTATPEIENITNMPVELAHGLGTDAYSASSNNGADQTADKAFDEHDWTPWQAAPGAQINAPQWLMVDFGSTKTVSRVDFSQYNNRAKLFKFQVSDDATEWKDAFYGKVGNAADDGGTVKYTAVFPEITGRYFRIYFIETAGDSTGGQTQPAIFDMYVYDRAGDGVTFPEIADLLGDDAPKELAHGLPNKLYKASTAQKDQEAKNAFDADIYSVWQAESTAQVSACQWLMVDFSKTESISRIDFIQYRNRTRQFKLQVSEDTETWTDAFKGNIPGASDAYESENANYTVVFPTVNGRYFRILFLDMVGKVEDDAIPSMPAIFDMKIYDKAGDASTSAEVHEGLLDPEDSFKPPAPVNPLVKPVNLALGKGDSAYTSSSNLDGQPPQAAFDGNGSSNWQNSGNSFPAWIQVDLGEKTAVNGMWISQWSNRIKYFKVHVSDDGQNWSTAFYGRVTDAEEIPTSSELSIAFPMVTARFVRLTITDGVYDEPNKQLFNVPIYEIEVYCGENWANSENVVDVETERPTPETLNALKEVLERIEALDESAYTEKSFEALKKIYQKAKTYEDGTVGNNTEVLEIIETLKKAEKDLIPVSSYNELRDLLKEIRQMNSSEYHPDDWNSLMLLADYANVLLQKGDADTSEVSFYVKSIDIMLASMRSASEEELDYEYVVNPSKSNEYIKEEILVDGDNDNTGSSVATGEAGVCVFALLLVFASAVAIKMTKKKKAR